MGTLVEKLQKLAATKDSIKAAIIGKGQAVADSDTFASYADKISAIHTGIDTSDATITADDIRNGKIGYSQDGKVIGSVPDVEIATPSISVSNTGLITALAAQKSAGFVAAGSASATQQLTTKSAATYTPGTSNQTIPAWRYLTGAQTIKGDANLQPANIRKGVTLFGKTGTYAGVGAEREILVAANFSMAISSSNVTISLNTQQNIGTLLNISLRLKGSIMVCGPLADEGRDGQLYVEYASVTDGWRADTDYASSVTVDGHTIDIVLKPGSTKIGSFVNGLIGGAVTYIPA